MINQMIQDVVHAVALYGFDLQMPFMVFSFLFGFAFRSVIYFTVHCEYVFALEFEKRVHKHLGDPEKHLQPNSFHQLTKKLLEKTYHEHFELKAKFKRRRFDHITTVTDRLFLIQAGANRLVKDTLSQTKYLKKGQGRDPKFLDLSKYVFSSNPVFNKVFAVFSMGMFNDVLNLLPGLFVIGGIFGTFLGTMQALPALSQIDISNAEATKGIMDTFLLKMAHCMSSSIVGIGLSVGMTVINAILSPEGMYIDMVNKFTSSIEFLWNDTDTNELHASDTKEDGDRRAAPATKKLKTWAPKTTARAASAARKAAAEKDEKENVVTTDPTPTEVIPRAEMEKIAAAKAAEEAEAAAEKAIQQQKEMLRLKIARIEGLRKKATAEKEAGSLPEALWAEEEQKYQADRQKLEAELASLDKKKAA